MSQGKENTVQSAIAGALQVYCQNRNLHLFPPYPNQQGEQLRKYCGDLFGLVDGADLIALEIKELDVTRGIFPAFDEKQHKIAKQFESLGVPLAYAYNAIATLPYHERPQPPQWAMLTLASVKRSMPTPLPGRQPAVTQHDSLLNWLDGPHGTTATDLFGRVHGALTAVDDLRNGILVLLYAVPKDTLVALTPEDMIRAVEVLSNNAHLSRNEKDRLQRLLGASANVFNHFVPPVVNEEKNNKPKHPRPGRR